MIIFYANLDALPSDAIQSAALQAAESVCRSLASTMQDVSQELLFHVLSLLDTTDDLARCSAVSKDSKTLAQYFWGPDFVQDTPCWPQVGGSGSAGPAKTVAHLPQSSRLRAQRQCRQRNAVVANLAKATAFSKSTGLCHGGRNPTRRHDAPYHICTEYGNIFLHMTYDILHMTYDICWSLESSELSSGWIFLLVVSRGHTTYHSPKPFATYSLWSSRIDFICIPEVQTAGVSKFIIHVG